VTAAVLGPSFLLEDAAEMIGETRTALLPTVEETISAGIMCQRFWSGGFPRPCTENKWSRKS
jgi:hypothetical protein